MNENDNANTCRYYFVICIVMSYSTISFENNLLENPTKEPIIQCAVINTLRNINTMVVGIIFSYFWKKWDPCTKIYELYINKLNQQALTDVQELGPGIYVVDIKYEFVNYIINMINPILYETKIFEPLIVSSYLFGTLCMI